MKRKQYIFPFVLCAWSILVTCIVILWNYPTDEWMVSYSFVRVDLMEEFMAIIRNGEIPEFLSAYEHSYGYALYLPYIGVLLGINEGWQLLLWVQLGAMAILMVVFPFEILYIFENKVVAFLTPIFVHLFCGNVLYGFKTDSFWGMAWSIMLTVPLIFKLWKSEWKKSSWILLTIIALICSLGNVMRNHNGFIPMLLVMFVLIIKVFKKELRFLNFLLLGIIFYILYESVSTFIPLFIGTLFKLPTLSNASFLWHAILAGWGVYPNQYGFQCNDGVILELVQKYYPYEMYATDEYANSCKKFVFYILLHDPMFVIRTYLKKFAEMIVILIKYNFSDKGEDFYYYNTGLYTIRNIFIPSVAAVLVNAYVFIKKKLFLSLQKYMGLIILCFMGIIFGTVEAVILIPELKYGLAAVICAVMIPMYISLITVHWITLLIRRKKMLRNE